MYGSTEAANLVLVTSLDVVVQNMLQGPAGLLRNAKFFADAKALEWLEADKRQASTALFGTEGTLDSKREQGLFGGGLKMPWD